MVLNKRFDRTSDPAQLLFNSHVIEETDRYKYLGVIFSNEHNSLKYHFNHARDKARRAICAMKTYLRKSFGSEMPYVLLLKLFDQQIRPILEYGSEIWCPKKPNQDIEKIQTSFIKNIFRLGRQTPTLAVLGETGRFPLHLRQQDSQIKYWSRIQTLPKNNILVLMYNDLFDLAMEGHDTWSGRVLKLIKDFTGNDIHDFDKIQTQHIINNSREFRYQDYINKFFQDINNANMYPKLRFYRELKTTYCIEPYILDTLNKNSQRALFRLRASSHQLEVERGRHTRPFTPLHLRICKYCDENAVDDEFHFLFKCTFHNLDRHNMLERTCILDINCRQYGECRETAIELLKSRNPDIIRNIARYVYVGFHKRYKLDCRNLCN